MTMHLSHLPIAEPRHLLYVGVPKASSPHNNFCTLFGKTGDSDLLDKLLDQLSSLRFSKKEDHDAQAKKVMHLITVGPKYLPPQRMRTAIVNALIVPPHHKLFPEVTAINIDDPGALRRLLERLKDQGFYFCARCKGTDHTIPACTKRHPS
jgi:hypothetical protein